MIDPLRQRYPDVVPALEGRSPESLRTVRDDTAADRRHREVADVVLARWDNLLAFVESYVESHPDEFPDEFPDEEPERPALHLIVGGRAA